MHMTKFSVKAYPLDFTVTTASATDQISLSIPELKHGIVSYYLMKAVGGLPTLPLFEVIGS